MKFEEFDTILNKLRAKPLKTAVKLALMILFILTGTFVINLVSEKAKTVVNTEETDKKNNDLLNLKIAIGKLSGKKKALAAFFEENADFIDIQLQINNPHENHDLPWSPKILISTLDSINYYTIKVVELSKKTEKSVIENDYTTYTQLSQINTVKVAFAYSLNEELQELSGPPPTPEKFKSTARKLRDEAKELDYIAKSLIISIE